MKPISEYAPPVDLVEGTNVFFKATAEDGWDLWTQRTINYGALARGEQVEVPRRWSSPPYHLCSSDVLHAARLAPQTLTAKRWPIRLFQMRGVPVVEDTKKAGFRKLKMIQEVPAYLALGPHGKDVLRASELLSTMGVHPVMPRFLLDQVWLETDPHKPLGLASSTIGAVGRPFASLVFLRLVLLQDLIKWPAQDTRRASRLAADRWVRPYLDHLPVDLHPSCVPALVDRMM